MLSFARNIENDICLFLLIYKHMENKILLTDSEMQVGTRTMISTQEKKMVRRLISRIVYFLKVVGYRLSLYLLIPRIRSGEIPQGSAPPFPCICCPTSHTGMLFSALGYPIGYQSHFFNSKSTTGLFLKFWGIR